jgi:hypothetical protein
MAGRPSIPFDQEIADEVCERIATTQLSLEDILLEMRNGDYPKTPSLRTVWRWLESNEAFRQSSVRAREIQGDYFVDLAVKEAFSSRIGEISTEKESKSGGTFTETRTADNVERSKLIVQTLLKRAGQLAPKKYGEKLDLNHGGSVGVQLVNDVPRPERK